MQKQPPLFLNVDLSPQEHNMKQPKQKMQLQYSKTPTKQSIQLKPQQRMYSPLESMATRQTSTMMSKADLTSKRSVVSIRSQLINYENRTETSEKARDYVERNDKSQPKTTDFSAFYQRALQQAVRVPSISSHSQATSVTPPRQIQQKILPSQPSQNNFHKKEAQKVKIFIRIKPINSNEKAIVKKLSNTHLAVNTFEDTQRQFEFAHIFDNSTQEEIYNTSSKNIVDDCVEGRANGVVLVYGQTGSGKTYTMGLLDQSKGLIQIALKDIFYQLDQQIKQKKCSRYSVEVSFIQVYLDKIYDLLNNTGQQLQIREQKDSHPYVQGCVSMQIEDSDEGIQLVALGVKNRVVAAQVMNLNSSRSHTLLTVYIKRQLIENNQIQEINSKVAFLDLAGSERNKKSQSKGMTLEEATSINQSLSALGNVIVALGQPNQQHVPYRESKLTRILQGYMTGESQISLICTITKLQDSQNETIQTLQFAQRCKDVVLRPQKFITYQDDETIDTSDLHKQINELKLTIINLEDQIKILKQQKQQQQIQQQQFQQNQQFQQEKEFNKFIISIIIKLKKYTNTNIQTFQEQEKKKVAENLYLNYSHQSPYQTDKQFPMEIQDHYRDQIFQEVSEFDGFDQCLEGNKEAIKELARTFTSDLHYLIQCFKTFSEIRGQNIINKINQIYRQKELNAWSKGIAYLLQNIKQQHIQYLEDIRQLKQRQSNIASDYYMEQIQQQVYQIICDRGLLYKSNKYFIELIDNNLKQQQQQQQQQLKELRRLSNNFTFDQQQNQLPDKYKNKIDVLIKNYGIPNKQKIKREDPPPIFHSATVNISNLIQSRKYQQNPFNDISSLDNVTELQQNSLDESNPMANLQQQEEPCNDDISLTQGGKLKFREDDFISNYRQSQQSRIPFSKRSGKQSMKQSGNTNNNE